VLVFCLASYSVAGPHKASVLRQEKPAAWTDRLSKRPHNFAYKLGIFSRNIAESRLSSTKIEKLFQAPPPTKSHLLSLRR
jgi:hypothetical protein